MVSCHRRSIGTLDDRINTKRRACVRAGSSVLWRSRTLLIPVALLVAYQLGLDRGTTVGLRLASFLVGVMPFSAICGVTYFRWYFSSTNASGTEPPFWHLRSYSPGKWRVLGCFASVGAATLGAALIFPAARSMPQHFGRDAVPKGSGVIVNVREINSLGPLCGTEIDVEIGATHPKTLCYRRRGLSAGSLGSFVPRPRQRVQFDYRDGVFGVAVTHVSVAP